MNLIPWKRKAENGTRELSGLHQFRGEMDRLFDRFFQGWPSTEDSLLAPETWMPPLDVNESENEVSVRAEIPGVDPKDLDLNISGNMLRISGQKKEEKEEKNGGFHHRESFFGSFERIIPLPAEVDVEHVQAEHANGVLTVHLQKTGKSKSRRIEVKAK